MSGGAHLPPLNAWQCVLALLASPGLNVLMVTPRHAAVGVTMVRELSGISGDLVHDAHMCFLSPTRGGHRSGWHILTLTAQQPH